MRDSDRSLSRRPAAAILGVSLVVLAAAHGASSSRTEQRTITLAPEDTFVTIGGANESASAVLVVYTWPDYRAANAILMKFDVSSLPSGAIVERATLRLALIESDGKGGAYTVGAHQLTRNPDIGRTTGLRLAEGDLLAADDWRDVNNVPGFKSWDITSMVREWLAEPATNHGLLLNSDASRLRDHYRTFASVEHPDAQLRPHLEVIVAAAPGVAQDPADEVWYPLPEHSPGFRKRDRMPPTVSISAPAPGATVSGVVTLSASASDNVGVASVQFRLDGADFGAPLTSAPYLMTWDTGSAATGSHTVTAVARDAARNAATAVPIAVTVVPVSGSGESIASRYPGDVNIETDPDVIFVERFDEAALDGLFARWTDILNGPAMSFATDAPSGSPSGRSLNIPWSSSSSGGHLYRQLIPGVDDTLFVRYYIKYPTTATYNHSGIWVGGYNPPLAWPNPQAGSRPSGSDRFSAAAEQNTQTARFDHYDYWRGMHQSADSRYWGNLLLNNPNVQAGIGQWTCVEQMVKLNNPVTSLNGEHAIWLDGVKVSHLGRGFPNGQWSGGIFTQNASGLPFEGFQWRTDTNLNLNYLWLQAYATSGSGSLRYAHVVAAKRYIGCLTPGSPPPPPPVTGTWPNNPAGFATLNDQPWQAVIGNGWNYLRRAASRAADVVADASVPFSPVSALRMIFTPDMTPDSEPGVHWLGLPNLREIYTGWWMRVSPNWTCSPAGCGKIGFLFTNGAGQVYTNLYHTGTRTAPYFIGANTEWSPYGQRIWTPNVTTTPVNPGTWHRVEFYYRWETTPGVSGDGIIRWWVDGVLNGDHRNVHYPPSAFIELQYAPTLQNPPPAEQFMYIDHTYVSRR